MIKVYPIAVRKFDDRNNECCENYKFMHFKYNIYKDTHVRNYICMTCAIYIRVKQNYFKREAQCAKTATSRLCFVIPTQTY